MTDPDSVQRLPTISFIVVAYQEPERTRMCLEAIARQLYPYYQVIVSDDGGQDGSWKTVKDDLPGGLVPFLVRCERTTIEGVGVRNIPRTANVGAEAASGDILCFLQQDHIIQPDYGLWLARTFSSWDIMFGLMDRRDTITTADLDSLLRNLHLPELQVRYDLFMDQGRRLLVPFDDWRLTDGFDFAISRQQWVPMDEQFIGPSHAILDAMLTYRLRGLHFMVNPLMRLWHWEHPSRDPGDVDKWIKHSYKQMQDKWGEGVWNSTLVPKLHDFSGERKQMRERFGV